MPDHNRIGQKKQKNFQNALVGQRTRSCVCVNYSDTGLLVALIPHVTFGRIDNKRLIQAKGMLMQFLDLVWDVWYCVPPLSY